MNLNISLGFGLPNVLVENMVMQTPTPADDPSAPALKQESARKKVQSVDRALLLLEYLAEKGEPVRLRDISQFLKINVSTCHHLLSTLMDRGYVDQAEGRSYLLGSKVAQLAGYRDNRPNLADIAMDDLKALNAATGETVHLAVRQGRELATLTVLESHHVVRVFSGGDAKTDSFHATATGKAILAWLPDAVIDRLLAPKTLKKFTEKTITSRAELVEDLRQVRRHGYAVDDEEFQPSVICIGAAIRDNTGAVQGSFSCSLPIIRADKERLDTIKQQVRETAQSISKKLGHSTAAKAGQENTQTTSHSQGEKNHADA